MVQMRKARQPKSAGQAALPYALHDDLFPCRAHNLDQYLHLLFCILRSSCAGLSPISAQAANKGPLTR